MIQHQPGSGQRRFRLTGALQRSAKLCPPWAECFPGIRHSGHAGSYAAADGAGSGKRQAIQSPGHSAAGSVFRFLWNPVHVVMKEAATQGFLTISTIS